MSRLECVPLTWRGIGVPFVVRSALMNNLLKEISGSSLACRLARIHDLRFRGIHSSCDAFFPTLVRRPSLDSGTTALIGLDLNLKRRIDTMDHLHIYAILHVPAVDHLRVYIELIVVSSHTLWAQQRKHTN